MSDVSNERDILLADDDKEDVIIFETALKDIGLSYVLRCAENGTRLFVLLKERIPYILFLDINMPCEDGLACILEIRKNRAYDKLPVIMYTSNLVEKIIDECYQNGANFYLTKAYTFNTLKDNLKKIFDIGWEDTLHYPPRQNFVLS